MWQNHGDSRRNIPKPQLKTHFTQVTVLHPAHPLCGQVFPVIQQSSGEVLIQISNGQQYFIPLDWTDQTSRHVTLPGACFLLEHLLTLRKRLEALSQENRKLGTIPSQSNSQAEGEKYGKAEPVHIGATIPGAAHPGDCHFGADDSAPDESSGRGETK
jgi:hypothetical protein